MFCCHGPLLTQPSLLAWIVWILVHFHLISQPSKTPSQETTWRTDRKSTTLWVTAVPPRWPGCQEGLGRSAHQPGGTETERPCTPILSTRPVFAVLQSNVSGSCSLFSLEDIQLGKQFGPLTLSRRSLSLWLPAPS